MNNLDIWGIDFDACPIPKEERDMGMVMHSAFCIIDIVDPSEAVMCEAAKVPDVYPYIKHPTEAVKIAHIKSNPHQFYHIINPSYELQVLAVQIAMHPRGWPITHTAPLKFIDNPSIELQLLSVQQDGLTIQYIENPDEEVQLAAVRQNPLAIQYIKNPTDAVGMIALLMC